MQDIIKKWPILILLPMCTADAGLSIIILLISSASFVSGKGFKDAKLVTFSDSLICRYVCVMLMSHISK